MTSRGLLFPDSVELRTSTSNISVLHFLVLHFPALHAFVLYLPVSHFQSPRHNLIIFLVTKAFCPKYNLAITYCICTLQKFLT